MDTALGILFGIGALITLAYAMTTPRSEAGRLLDDMERRGLTPQEQRDEMALRVAIVDVQIKATAKVVVGASAFDAVRDAAEAYCSQLARLDRPLARRILQHLSGLPVNELLLPEAVEIHERRWAGFKAPPLDDKVRAALRLK